MSTAGSAKSRRKTWRCFFCDEVFRTRRAAYRHFGEENCESDVPACVDPLRTDEKARMDEVRQARDFAQKCQNDMNRAEELAEGLQSEHDNFFRYFGPDCNNMWQAADRYKNALYELSLLRGNHEHSPCFGQVPIPQSLPMESESGESKR